MMMVKKKKQLFKIQFIQLLEIFFFNKMNSLTKTCIQNNNKDYYLLNKVGTL